MRKLKKFAVVCLMSILPFHTMADIYSQVSEPDGMGLVLNIFFIGSLSSGQAEKLRAEIGKYQEGFSAKLMVLNSTGGDVEEAMKMGNLLREEGFDAYVPRNGRCESACIYLLAAGMDKRVYGPVGIHRPYFNLPPHTDAGGVIRTLKRRSAEYFEKMNIPAKLAEDMYSIPPAEMKVLSLAELKNYRLNQRDFVEEERIAAEQMKAMGWSREQYEAFQGGLKYRCTVFTGDIKNMRSCIRNVAIEHGAPQAVIDQFSD